MNPMPLLTTPCMWISRILSDGAILSDDRQEFLDEISGNLKIAAIALCADGIRQGHDPAPHRGRKVSSCRHYRNPRKLRNFLYAADAIC